MVGWHHRLNGHEFEQTLGEGQRSLACCSLWGHKESNTRSGRGISSYYFSEEIAIASHENARTNARQQGFQMQTVIKNSQNMFVGYLVEPPLTRVRYIWATHKQ